MSAPAGPYLPIETDRLLLRAFEPGDLDALAAIHGDPGLVRWIPWGPRTREQAAEVLERKMKRVVWEQEGDGPGIAPVVKETGEMIGDFTLQYASVEHSTAEFGYMLARSFQGRGYATEAATAILDLAFGELGMHRVMARIEARNAPSIALAERLGMRREAEFVENEWVKGEWQSELVYAILDREWGRGGGRSRP